jgi:hypothetical protein
MSIEKIRRMREPTFHWLSIFGRECASIGQLAGAEKPDGAGVKEYSRMEPLSSTYYLKQSPIEARTLLQGIIALELYSTHSSTSS